SPRCPAAAPVAQLRNQPDRRARAVPARSATRSRAISAGFAGASIEGGGRASRFVDRGCRKMDGGDEDWRNGGKRKGGRGMEEWRKEEWRMRKGGIEEGRKRGGRKERRRKGIEDYGRRIGGENPIDSCLRSA